MYIFICMYVRLASPGCIMIAFILALSDRTQEFPENKIAKNVAVAIGKFSFCFSQHYSESCLHDNCFYYCT